MDPWVIEMMMMVAFEWDGIPDLLLGRRYDSVAVTKLNMSPKKPKVKPLSFLDPNNCHSSSTHKV